MLNPPKVVHGGFPPPLVVKQRHCHYRGEASQSAYRAREDYGLEGCLDAAKNNTGSSLTRTAPPHEVTARAKPTLHADAAEAPDLVQAGGVVLAGVGYALVDVEFAARPVVALHALAGEGALGVETLASVLARVRP